MSLSSDPIDNIINIEVSTKGKHATLGLVLKNNPDIGGRLQVLDCTPSTPAAKIPKWRSTIRQSFLHAIDGKNVYTQQEVEDIVNKVRKGGKTINLQFATMTKQAMHPQEGIPLIYHDQMNIIATHLAEIKDYFEEQGEAHQKYYTTVQAQIATLQSSKKKAKLTRKILKKQIDWFEWEAAERKQLQQYEAQGMFSSPISIPEGANCLPFMWTYTIKDDGTKKARAP